MATAFTTWDALRTAILDAMANNIAGTPCVGEYQINGRRIVYRTFGELQKLYENTFKMEATGSGALPVSYGSHRGGYGRR